MSCPGGHPQLSSSVIVQLAYPTPPRAQRDSGLSGHGGLLMHVASTTRWVCPQLRADTGPGESSGPPPRATQSAEGEKAWGPMSSPPCFSQGPQTCSVPPRQLTTPLPVATQEATSCPTCALTEIWPCWPSGPFGTSSQGSGCHCGGCCPLPAITSTIP